MKYVAVEGKTWLVCCSVMQGDIYMLFFSRKLGWKNVQGINLEIKE